MSGQEIRVISFGYLHGDPPTGALAVDVRTCLHDPHIDPTLRELTGRDTQVQDRVLRTPGAGNVIHGLVDLAEDLVDHGIPLAVGCAGGRHRSVVIANEVAALLRDDGYEVGVEHRDIDRPVVHRQPEVAR